MNQEYGISKKSTLFDSRYCASENIDKGRSWL